MPVPPVSESKNAIVTNRTDGVRSHIGGQERDDGGKVPFVATAQ